jgi:hypothetical protein
MSFYIHVALFIVVIKTLYRIKHHVDHSNGQIKITRKVLNITSVRVTFLICICALFPFLSGNA